MPGHEKGETDVQKTCRVLCFVLALVFLFPLGLLPASASGGVFEVTLVVGRDYSTGSGYPMWAGATSGEISSIYAVGGSMTPDLTVIHDDYDLWVEGIPMTVGSWTITIEVQYTDSSTEQFDVTVHVIENLPDPPYISGIYGGGTFEVGETCTLTADVLITNSDTMDIIWYRAYAPNYPDIKAVTDSVFTFTPPQTVGTMYYCYGVRGRNFDGNTSAFVYSPFVEVTYTEPATPPPVTSPPVTSPPVTSPPVTSPPVTSPPVTTAPVTPSAPTVPTFNDVTGGGTYQMGETCTLECDASYSGTIRYIWYGSDEKSYESMELVQDGTESKYTVPQIEGTRYYCVAICDGDLDDPWSTMTTSDFITVTYVGDPNSTPSGGKGGDALFPSTSPTDGHEAGAGSNRGQGTTGGTDPSADPSGTSTGRGARPGLITPTGQKTTLELWKILVPVGAVLVIAAIVVVVVLLARKNRNDR